MLPGRTYTCVPNRIAPASQQDPAVVALSVTILQADLTSLFDIEDECLRDTKSLNLHGNRIEKLDSLNQLFRLTELNLSSNMIQAISAADFGTLVHLRRLDLSANRIRSLENFPSLPALEQLRVAYNKIRGHGMESFSIHIENQGKQLLKLPKLKHLDLRDNRLSSLPHLVLQSIKFQCRDGSHANTVCHAEGYLDTITKLLPHCGFVDGREVCYQEDHPVLPKFDFLAQRYKRRHQKLTRDETQVGYEQFEAEFKDRSFSKKTETKPEQGPTAPALAACSSLVGFEEADQIANVIGFNGKDRSSREVGLRRQTEKKKEQHFRAQRLHEIHYDCSRENRILQDRCGGETWSQKQLDALSSPPSDSLLNNISDADPSSIIETSCSDEKLMEIEWLKLALIDSEKRRLSLGRQAPTEGTEANFGVEDSTRTCDDSMNCSKCIERKAALSKTEKEVQKLESHVHTLETKVLQLERQCTKSNELLQSAKAVMLKENTNESILQETINTKNAQLANLQMELAVCHDRQTHSDEKVTQLNLEIERLRSCVQKAEQRERTMLQARQTSEENARQMESSSAQRDQNLREALHKAQQRYEELDATLGQKEHAIKVLQGELDRMKLDLDRAEEERDRAENRRLQSVKLQERIRKQAEKLATSQVESALDHMKTELQKQQRDASGHLQQLQDVHMKAVNEATNLKKMLAATVQREQEAKICATELSKLVAEQKQKLLDVPSVLNNLLASETERQTQMISVLQADVQSSRSSAADASKKQQQAEHALQQEIDRQKSMTCQWEDRLSVAQEQITRGEELVREHSTAVSVKDAMLDEQNDAIRKLKSSKVTIERTMQHEIHELRDRVETLEFDLETATADRDQLEQSSRQHQDTALQVQDLRTELQGKQQEVVTLLAQVASLKEHISSKAKALKFVEAEVSEMKVLFKTQAESREKVILEKKTQASNHEQVLHEKLTRMTALEQELDDVRVDLLAQNQANENLHSALAAAAHKQEAMEAEMRVLLNTMDNQKSEARDFLQSIINA